MRGPRATSAWLIDAFNTLWDRSHCQKQAQRLVRKPDEAVPFVETHSGLIDGIHKRNRRQRIEHRRSDLLAVEDDEEDVAELPRQRCSFFRSSTSRDDFAQ